MLLVPEPGDQILERDRTEINRHFRRELLRHQPDRINEPGLIRDADLRRSGPRHLCGNSRHRPRHGDQDSQGEKREWTSLHDEALTCSNRPGP